MRRLLHAIPLLAVAAMAPLPASAQDPTMRVDTLVRIVAIAGDSVVTNAELRRSVELWFSSFQQPVPAEGTEPDTLLDRLLNERIDALLLVQAALNDTSIVVTDDEVRTGVDAQVAQVQANYPTPRAFEQALNAGNLTLQEYRSMLGAQLRQQRLIDAYMGKQLRARNAPPVSDQAVRAYFNAQLGSGGTPPTLPPSVTFAQIVIPVLPSDTALARAKAKADSLLQLIRVEGQDFATLARRFSEDPGSAELGGDLGWFRPGGMTLNFELAAYSPLLRPGDVSDPVLTQYGYHLIKLERIRGPERQARHILIRPATYDEDRDRARNRADSVATLVRAGASLDSLRRIYGDRDEPERLGPVVRDSMPAEYVAALANASDGDILGPFAYTADGPKWVILRVERIEGERQATVEDYRERIQEAMGRERLIQEILAELKRQTYIEIRPRAKNPRS